MKTILKLEEMLMLIACIFALIWIKAAWWYYLALLLGPDIGIAAYAFGNKVGAVCYNLFHHKGIATVLIITGIFYNQQLMLMIGLIMLGHSSMDRLFGYGLKYKQGFKFTHLVIIGKNIM